MIDQAKIKMVSKEMLNRVKINNVPATKVSIDDKEKINSLAFYQCGVLLNNEEILEIQNNCLNELINM